MPNSSWASITSRPLFISVDESTVIFGPMLQVGWARASSTVTSASSSRGAAPERAAAGGEHDAGHLAVGGHRRRRHWWTAQCSLSTGTSSAPGVARSGCTTGPAAIRLSLLASARRLPARSVARVTGRPAKPTTPLTHDVGRRRRGRPGRRRPRRTAAPRRPRARAAASATATSFGRNSRGLRDQRVDRRPDAEADDLVAGRGLGPRRRRASGCRSTRSTRRWRHGSASRRPRPSTSASDAPSAVRGLEDAASR